MTTRFAAVVLAFAGLVVSGGWVVSCGGSDATLSTGDGGHDATSGVRVDAGVRIVADAGLTPGLFGSGSGSGGGVPDGAAGASGACLGLGSACSSGSECCTSDCMNGECGYPACTTDGAMCSANGDCCSQTCVGGACASLNSACRTLGNTCAASADCCSGLCVNDTCQPSSFCGQGGDACSTGADCCTGTCTVATGLTLGTCGVSPPAGPANCGMVDGQLCGGSTTPVASADAGLPACGGPCCSRACAPWGPTGVLVCQPASGCHVVGDLCTQDGDCCGSAGLPGGSGKPVTCVITAPATVGVCRLPMGCKPDGDVCKLKTMSCNSSCDCCSGNCENKDTCKQDNVGVPRCAPAQCVSAGGACASSASCCGGMPCVPNPVNGAAPPFVCAATACVAACQACTDSADCCPGTSCVAPSGSTHGICGPCGGEGTDAGTGGGYGNDSGTGGGYGNDSGVPASCALYGQVCTASAQCCNGVPCDSLTGRCDYPLQ